MKPPGVRGHPPAALPTPQQGSANGKAKLNCDPTAREPRLAHKEKPECRSRDVYGVVRMREVETKSSW